VIYRRLAELPALNPDGDGEDQMPPKKVRALRNLVAA
jgi:hypothetical protein